MRLTAEQQQTIIRYAAQYGLPVGDEAARLWTKRLAETFKALFGASWGHKNAGSGRPPSTDVIAYKAFDQFYGYDVIVAQGAPEQRLDPNPAPIDLTGQVFIPVDAHNWLDDDYPKPLPEPDDRTLLVEVQDILEKLTHVYEEVMWQRKAVESAVTDLKKLQALAPMLIEAITKGIKIRF